ERKRQPNHHRRRLHEVGCRELLGSGRCPTNRQQPETADAGRPEYLEERDSPSGLRPRPLRRHGDHSHDHGTGMAAGVSKAGILHRRGDACACPIAHWRIPLVKGGVQWERNDRAAKQTSLGSIMVIVSSTILASTISTPSWLKTGVDSASAAGGCTE